MKKRVLFLYLWLILMLFSSLVFAGDYTSEDMDNRERVQVGGVSAVAQGEPVECWADPSGLYAAENFIGNDGKVYFPGQQIISYNDKGVTGNVREENHITFEDGSLTGTNDNSMYIDVIAQPVLKSEKTNENGETVYEYNLPYAEIGTYQGDIYTSTQDFINYLNETGFSPERLEKAGYTEWTIETYNEIFGKFGMTVENESVFYNAEFITQIYQASYVDGKLIWKGIDKDGITGITAFGADLDMMQALSDFYKLYSVNGDLTFEEWLEKYVPEPDPEPEPDDPGGDTPSTPAGEWSDLGLASVSANVWSDKYDVSTAIPTSEMVYGSISASDMSWYYNVKAYPTEQSYTISGIAIHWDPYQVLVDDGYYNASGDFIKTGSHWETRYRYSESVTVEGTYTTHYFGVERAEMNKLHQKVNGVVRGGGSLTNGATGTLATLPNADIAGSIDKSGGIVFDEGRMSKGAFSTYAETRSGAIASAKGIIAARIKRASFVKNDQLVIKSNVLGGQTEYNEEFKSTPYIAPSYLNSPSAGTLSDTGSKMIPSSKANGNYASSASATYIQVPGFDGKADYSKGAGAPSVFVWTPVVNNATITTESFINQKVIQEANLTYLQLDKKFTINIPRAGEHLGARGYGSRDYNSYQAVPGRASNWGRIKDVKLPFDTYLQPNNRLIKANTWLSDMGLATTEESYTFVIPVWAEEAKGTIETRVVAENAIYGVGSTCSSSIIAEIANKILYTTYVAEKKIPVEVIGKIYDLRVSGTNDPGWPGIKGKDGDYISEEELPFGQAGQNARPQYKFAPKLGYSVEFDFKTKGIKTDNVNVSVQPEGFYFISKKGGNAEEVDLYFKTTTSQYVKIEAGTPNPEIIVNLSNQFMKVARSEIIDSQRIMRVQIGVLYTYAENVLIGKLPELHIPEKLRLCYNNFAEYVNKLYGKEMSEIISDADGGLAYSTNKYEKVMNGKDTVIASVGHWYAAYRLPSSTIAVPKGTTTKQIITTPDIAKENGYILVKFDIVGKNGNEDYLRYTGPESIAEPHPTTQEVTLPNGQPGTVPDGTVMIFETDLKANNDYEVIGTH